MKAVGVYREFMGSESTLSSHSAGNKVPGTKENSGSVELTQEQAGHSATR